jgi:hypothetical protein
MRVHLSDIIITGKGMRLVARKQQLYYLVSIPNVDGKCHIVKHNFCVDVSPTVPFKSEIHRLSLTPTTPTFVMWSQMCLAVRTKSNSFEPGGSRWMMTMNPSLTKPIPHPNLPQQHIATINQCSALDGLLICQKARAVGCIIGGTRLQRRQSSNCSG